MGFFDFFKSDKKRSDEGIKRTVKKPLASIVHNGNKYTFLAAYKFNAYALERQYILRNNNIDSVLKKANTLDDGIIYCIYTRESAVKETTGKPKKRASTKKRKFVF